MRPEWIDRLKRAGFVPQTNTNRSVWDLVLHEATGQMPDIVVRMMWCPRDEDDIADGDDSWLMEWIFNRNGHVLHTLPDASFDYCMATLVDGPCGYEKIRAYLNGYRDAKGYGFVVCYYGPESGYGDKSSVKQDTESTSGRSAWHIAKERLLSEGWKDAGAPNLEYTSEYCGLGYTIRATMQDDGKFSVGYWGDTGALQGCLGLSLDDVSAMAKKTLYELMPRYVEICAEKLRKVVSARKCADEYFSFGKRCHILPPGVPDEWLDKLHEKGFAVGDTKVTAYKNVNMLNGKAYKVIVTLTGTAVHVEIGDACQDTPVVNFGVNSDSLDSALTSANEWLLEQSREA